MKLTNLHTKAQTFVSEVITSRAAVKILAGVTIGALLMTATALPSGFVHADDPARPVMVTTPSHQQLMDDLGEWVTVSQSKAIANFADYDQLVDDLGEFGLISKTAGYDQLVDDLGEFGLAGTDV